MNFFIAKINFSVTNFIKTIYDKVILKLNFASTWINFKQCHAKIVNFI